MPAAISLRGNSRPPEGRVTLSDFVTTRRSCIGSLEEQERRFLGAVSDVVEWKIEQGLLLMLDARGRIGLSICQTRASSKVALLQAW